MLIHIPIKKVSDKSMLKKGQLVRREDKDCRKCGNLGHLGFNRTTGDLHICERCVVLELEIPDEVLKETPAAEAIPTQQES